MEESPRKAEGKKQDMKEAPTVWFHLDEVQSISYVIDKVLKMPP